jgi:hypothetical protein
MYTDLPTVRGWGVRGSGLALGLGLGLWFARPAAAQDPPVRLPGMVITASPLPGPRVLTGVVRDTSGDPVNGVEITIPDLKRRLYNDADGLFRFDSMPRGKHRLRARKIGYAPQVREVVVGDSGAVAEFEIVPFARALPPMVTSAERGGLSGVVGDTAFRTLPGAAVRLLGHGMHTTTDSLGTFFIPAKPGVYMVAITKEGYGDRMVGVTIPEDSGRRIMAWLQPSSGSVEVRAVHNVEDLRYRIAWMKKSESVLYTRDQLLALDIEWLYDAVAMTGAKFGATEAYSRDCNVMVNGGPLIRNLATITIDEVESLEVYPGSIGGKRTVGGVTQGSFGASKKIRPAGVSNTYRADFDNQTRFCPIAYVWFR